MPQIPDRVRAKGEAYVWLTAMGLALGLMMIVTILGVIVCQGFDAFWPRRVIVATLKPGSQTGLAGQALIAGEVVSRRERADSHGSGRNVQEWQFYVANRDLYGYSFKFVDASEIVKLEEPADACKIEFEEGFGLGRLAGLRLAGGETLPATAADFEATLARLAGDCRHRRDRIAALRDQIGEISTLMERSRLELRQFEKTEQPAAQERERQRIRELQAQYDPLAAEVGSWQAQQETVKLLYRTFTGEDREAALGSVVAYSHPNRLGLAGRVGLALRQVWTFLSEAPRAANTQGGIFPAIFGTFVMTLLMSVVVTPVGVVAAVYLHEYAKQGPLVRGVRIAVNNLAGVPSIVFGVFGLGFFVYVVGSRIDEWFFAERLPTPTFGTGGLLWCSLTLAMLTVPVIIVATEEALAAVPRGAREGSLALGASKWQTIQRVVLPAAAPGVMTGMILAMARGAGEVAPLMLVGVVKLAPTLPLNLTAPFLHLDQKFMHLGFHIYDLGFQSPDSEAARPMVFATTLFLIVLVVVLNLTGILVRERLRRKYRGSTF